MSLAATTLLLLLLTLLGGPCGQPAAQGAAADQAAGLLRWLASRGARWAPGVEPRRLEASAERGLFAADDIEAGQEVLVVPASALLRQGACDGAGELTRALRRSAGGRRVGPSSTALLLTCFIDQRGLPSSEHRAYFDSLPESVEHLPLLADPLRVDALLEGTSTLTEIHHKREEMRWVYEALEKEAPALMTGLPWEEFLRAWGTVESHSHSNDGEPAMIPLVDMVNHRSDPNLELRRSGDDVAAVAVRAILAGEELSFSYAGHPATQSAQQVFRQFGFWDPSLGVRVRLSLHLSPSDAGFDSKKAFFPEHLVRSKAMWDKMRDVLDEEDLSEEKLLKMRSFPEMRDFWCPRSAGEPGRALDVSSPAGPQEHRAVRTAAWYLEDALAFYRFVVLDDAAVAEHCDGGAPPRCPSVDAASDGRARARLAQELRRALRGYRGAVGEEGAGGGPAWAPYEQARRSEAGCILGYLGLTEATEPWRAAEL